MDSPESLPLVGQTLGHYRVLAVLGEGGMGIVYRAFDERLHRNVALKVLPDDAMKNEERRRRFLREARSAAAVTHANVAAVHEVGEANGHVFIAMELIEGRTLLDELAKVGKLPMPEALRIGRAIARALAKAHEKGIIHRDLKPENVMLGDEREVKVLDFGLAKLLEGKSSKSLLEVDETATGASIEGRVIGTPAYMSPEQAMGMKLDARSDVFSFGVVLYQMMAGERPFNGVSPLQVMVAVTRDEAPALSKYVPDVLPALELLVMTCLQKDPQKRFANGRALLEAIDALDASKPSQMSSPTLESMGTPRPEISIETVTKDSARRPAAKVKRGALVAALAIGAVVAAAFVAARSTTHDARSTTSPGPATSASSALGSSIPEAARLFARTLREEREGRYEIGCADAARASDLDPAFAEAHLFAALCRRGVPREGREYFRRAWEAREALPPTDEALLESLEPMFQRDPEDVDEELRRLESAVAKYPDDARARFILAVSYRRVGRVAEANVELARSLQIDGRQPHAFELQSDYLAYDGDFKRSNDAIEKCLALAPSAIGCLLERVWIDSERGDCAGAEATARRMLTVDAENDDAQRALANALHAEGRPLATSRELLKRIAERHPDDLGARIDAIHLAAIAGDFVTAEKLAQQLRSAAAQSAVAAVHAVPASLLVAIDRESKRDAEAAAIAGEYLDGRDAWEPDERLEDWALQNDPTPAMLAARLQAGVITHDAFVKERDATLARWNARVEKTVRAFVWDWGWAVPSESKADALAAIAAMPQYAPLPPYKPLSLLDEPIGRTYLLAGDVARALDALGAATRSCAPIDHPFESTRAFAELGQAKEASGDRDAACAAYQVVRDRWGNAKPASITADRAAARIAALGCHRATPSDVAESKSR